MSRRKLQINKKHCKYAELEKEYDKCQDPAMKTKLLAILQTWDGLTSTDVAWINKQWGIIVLTDSSDLSADCLGVSSKFSKCD